MTPRTRPLTTVGVIAAAAAISSSDSAPTSSYNLWHPPKSVSAFIRLPRGGSTESHQDGDVHNKHHKKKKKRSKAEKRETNYSDATNEQTNESQSNQEETVLPPEISHILTTSCHYSVLGLPKSASQTEILKAYRKKCVLTHPDKLPAHIEDRRGAFDKVSKAYDVLSCEKKRAMYDRFGNDAIEGEVNDAEVNGFGQDVFKDFFGASFFNDPFSGRRQQNPNGNPFRRPPRNKDLRYNLEVTLEDLYNGATKHVAIQQPNPLQPHYPLRKELEVSLSPGLVSGQSVRISGVVDSIPNCAPADVVFILSERRHSVFTRRGCDLAMEVKISLGESVGGWRREVRCLDGKIVVIGPPKGKVITRKKERAVDATINVPNTTMGVLSNTTTTVETETFQLPETIIQTGDVHVLKGRGMPKRSNNGPTHQHGDLYIQYVVEMPGDQNYKSNNLSDEERIELARLLYKLEGKDDTSIEESETNTLVHYLETASASDFGKSQSMDTPHDEHLHQDDPQDFHTNDLNDFFQRAFTRRSSFGNFGSSGAFHYFSSGRGGDGHGGDDHNVECNQM